jgi:4-hydroxy-tetrahydrodipicolinate reductase
MNIAIIGYGKMGKAIEQLALERGHTISAIIDSSDFTAKDLKDSNVAIEFTQPDSAYQNIKKCIMANVPVVVGTTGWYDQYQELKDLTLNSTSALFTATNFSIGVNILFHLNKKLGAIMNGFKEYDVTMNETHHIHKKDHPSGTAVTLAEGILNTLDRKNKYIGLLEGQKEAITPFDLQIISKRENEVPGFHEIKYESNIDEITISHNAKSRQGFAIGSIIAAEWLAGKKGVFNMQDLLNFE